MPFLKSLELGQKLGFWPIILACIKKNVRMPCIKKCYQQTTHQSQPSTSFYTNKVTLLKKSLKQTYYRSKLKTVEMMLKKHGKLLMNLFLQNLKKNKVGGETYNADLNTIKTAVFSYLEGRYPSIDATLFQIAQI